MSISQAGFSIVQPAERNHTISLNDSLSIDKAISHGFCIFYVDYVDTGKIVLYEKDWRVTFSIKSRKFHVHKSAPLSIRKEYTDLAYIMVKYSSIYDELNINLCSSWDFNCSTKYNLITLKYKEAQIYANLDWPMNLSYLDYPDDIINIIMSYMGTREPNIYLMIVSREKNKRILNSDHMFYINYL